MSVDANGRAYAKTNLVIPGLFLEFDRGFPCIEKGKKLQVQIDTGNELYVKCSYGHHYLKGSVDGDNDFYTGIYPVMLEGVT